MRRITLLILNWAICLVALSQPVSMSEALQKGQAFMNSIGKQLLPLPCKAPSASPQGDHAPYFIFNATKGEGYVIVSGDSRTDDILGYCDEGAFDEEQVPDNMKAWLQGYAEQIDALQRGVAQPAKVPKHAAIAPLLSSKWDQGVADNKGDAYNCQCPKENGKYCMTGCVATAMAQVMRYHQWPTSSTKAIPTYEANETLGTIASLSARKFDWKNMLDKYTGGETETQKNAVAWLMRYCGQAINMDYGTISSGTQTELVAMALRTYFGYDTDACYVLRADYSAAGWDENLYYELKNKRPVLYNGYSMGGGHAFVCDGCDSNGFYHINWGWGGRYDGYYKIALLNPNGGGTGSSGTDDGYTIDQGALFGVQKPTGEKYDSRILTLRDFTFDGSVIKATYWNRTGMDGKFQYGLAYRNVNSGDDSYNLRTKTEDFVPFQYTEFSDDVNEIGLKDGTYRFYPFNRLDGESWFRMQGDFLTYIEVVIKNKKAQSMSKHPIADLYVQGLECVGNKIVDMSQEVVITVTNKGEEFNKVFYLFASKTKEKGEYVSKTGMPIEAGATEQASLFFTPDSPGTWYLWVDIDETGANDIGPVKVEISNPPTTATNLQLVSHNIRASKECDIHVKVKNNGQGGYFRPLACALFNEEGGTSIDIVLSGNLDLKKGKSIELDFHFEGLTPGKKYFAMMACFPDHTSYDLGVFGDRMWFTPSTTAIDFVVTDFDKPTDIYSLTGVLIRRKATSIEGLPKGIYVIGGKKVMVR